MSFTVVPIDRVLFMMSKSYDFQNTVSVKVREGSVKGSVKAFQKHWVREGPVKVREGFR